MKPFLVDVPVLILFFNRPQQLSQVFEQVRNARPSKLFLYQDGPRSEHDLPGIKACREVTDQIDWTAKSTVCIRKKTTVATLRNTFHKNGLFLWLTNVSYWKMTMCLPFLFSHSVKKC